MKQKKKKKKLAGTSDLAEEYDKPESEEEGNGRQIHPHGSQLLEENNGQHDMENNDKKEFCGRDNVNDL
ncbi:hypothetical protein LguiA_036136 [Lonicera macranthoides]